LPGELHRFHGGKLIRCRAQADGRNHGGMRASADHCTHDRERRGQCQTDFVHGLFLVGYPMGRFDGDIGRRPFAIKLSTGWRRPSCVARRWTKGQQKGASLWTGLGRICQHAIF
jgi:hypothetical protein